MEELASYRLEDFLLFAPRTYFRLIELHHAAIWPAQLAALPALAAIAILMWRGQGMAVILAVLGAGWLFVAVSWFWLRYASINWAAGDLALGFVLEGLLLLALGASGRLRFAAVRQRRMMLALFLALVALLPLVAPLAGRGWRQPDLALVMPDATALATIAMLLGCAGGWRWLGMLVPLLWCLVTGLTLLAMDAPDAWLAPGLALGLLALGAGWAIRAGAHPGRRHAT